MDNLPFPLLQYRFCNIHVYHAVRHGMFSTYVQQLHGQVYRCISRATTKSRSNTLLQRMTEHVWQPASPASRAADRHQYDRT